MNSPHEPAGPPQGRIPERAARRYSSEPLPPAATAFRFDNSYARDLQDGFFIPLQPAAVPAPRLLFLNEPLADELGLDLAALDAAARAAIFAGNALPEGAEPLAQAYAGHQFGGFSPQLGDGRALLLGEVIDRAGRRRDIAFKGSGRTPFARGGDGKAAVGPMLREVLVSESMHALGIPTTRALAVAATGEDVFRERVLPGAVLTRVAASHLRVGTFQFYAARGDVARLRRLAEYTIARHDPALAGAPDRFLSLLRNVAERQAALIAQWMNVGFIHGVMNTDNMTISGETIDYGPCAFMEAYDPAAVFSSIDEHGRYAFGNQPLIARWNLVRLAESLLPLIADGADEAVRQATEIIDAFPGWYARHLLRGQRAKLGLRRDAPDDDAIDTALVDDWLRLLQSGTVDFTLAWRRLADAAAGDEAPLRALFAQTAAPTGPPGPQTDLPGPQTDLPGAQADVPGVAADAPGAQADALGAWLERWRDRCASEDDAGEADRNAAGVRRAAAMRRVNPFVIARNHRVEEALSAASDHGDLGPFDRLLAAVRRPFDEAAEQTPYAEPAPAAVTARYQTFCGT